MKLPWISRKAHEEEIQAIGIRANKAVEEVREFGNRIMAYHALKEAYVSHLESLVQVLQEERR